MKRALSPTGKSTMFALAFFVVMTFVGLMAAHAQNDTLNPLLSTTGPNVLGVGRIQWSSSLDYYHLSQKYNQAQPLMATNSFGATTSLRFGATTSLRFGVGNRAELSLNVSGAYSRFFPQRLDITPSNAQNYYPSVGVKLLLNEGRGWLPKVSFYTHVGLAIGQNAYQSNQWFKQVQPEIGLMFRNNLGGGYVLDYSLGYMWNALSGPGIDIKNQIQYSIFARKLVGDRYTFGVGFGNNNSAHRFAGDLELRYLANPNLQLSARLGGTFGFQSTDYSAQAHALLGVHWTLR